MDVSPDLRELLASFHSHGVECIVVGAHALALHGMPRFTADLDLLLRRSEENVGRYWPRSTISASPASG